MGDLILRKRNPQEILILLCSRLDALASSAAKEDEPRRKSFADFVTGYGGFRDLFKSVSVGDLYYELGYHRWLLPGMIEKPGRVRRFSSLNDPFIRLLDECGVALTAKEADRLLSGIMLGLREAFRVVARQSRIKSPVGTIDQVLQASAKKFGGPRSIVDGKVLMEKLRPVLSGKGIAALLYEKFRCGVIHGGRVKLNEDKFFTQEKPYWEPLYSEHYGNFLLIEFPAKFLRKVCRQCMTTYKRHLLTKKQVPPDVYFEMFEGFPSERLELLDQSLPSSPLLLGLKIPTR